ncbi:hypothetical protein MRX96_004286 [Rhipicephalus microplus]
MHPVGPWLVLVLLASEAALGARVGGPRLVRPVEAGPAGPAQPSAADIIERSIKNKIQANDKILKDLGKRSDRSTFKESSEELL